MKAQATRADEQPAAEWVETRSLHEWADNPRNNEDNVSRVADSIRRFGFAAPIVARRNGEIIAGHTRWKAALSLGLERVPVRFMDLSEREAHMLALADNRLNELATWEPAALQQLLGELSLQEAELVGWTEGDLKKMADELLASTEGHVRSSAPTEQEIGEESFSKFAHKCPRCGFEFDE